MVKYSNKFLDLKYKPSKKEVVVSYTINPLKNIRESAKAVAAESSIGTWTKLTTMNEKIFKRLHPTIFKIRKNNVHIAYPVELFEKGNMPQIMSSIAGNVFGMKEVKSLRLEDIEFPKPLLKSFKGPYFGVKGVRKLMKVKKRPLVGTIVKPKLGLDEKGHTKVAYNSWIGGCDIVKDDENLSNMSFNNFSKRMSLTLKAKRKAEKETGEKKIYMPNITAETVNMIARAKQIVRKKGEYIMVDILTCGWSSLQTIRNMNLKRVIHAHRAGHAAFTKKPNGISMLVVAKIARLIGVDQLHIGTAGVGKMEGNEREEIMIEKEIEEMSIKEGNHILDQNWNGIKPVFAVASGGLSPLGVPEVIKRMGTNVIIQAGGGIHGHPLGSYAGAKAMREAVEATMKGVKLKDYCDNHKALREAYNHWK